MEKLRKRKDNELLMKASCVINTFETEIVEKDKELRTIKSELAELLNVRDYCSIHEQKLICYCETCSQAVCTKCIVKEHKRHTFQEIEDVYRLWMGKIVVKLENMKATLKKHETDNKGYVSNLAKTCLRRLAQHQLQGEQIIQKESMFSLVDLANCWLTDIYRLEKVLSSQ